MTAKNKTRKECKNEELPLARLAWHDVVVTLLIVRGSGCHCMALARENGSRKTCIPKAFDWSKHSGACWSYICLSDPPSVMPATEMLLSRLRYATTLRYLTVFLSARLYCVVKRGRPRSSSFIFVYYPCYCLLCPFFWVWGRAERRSSTPPPI